MVRRDALLGPIGLVDEEIPGSYAEDFDWILRAAEAGRIAVVERDLVNVRWGQSLFSRNWQTIIDAVDYVLAKHAELRDRPAGPRPIARPASVRAGGARQAPRGAAPGVADDQAVVAGTTRLPGVCRRPAARQRRAVDGLRPQARPRASDAHAVSASHELGPGTARRRPAGRSRSDRAAPCGGPSTAPCSRPPARSSRR